MYGVSAAGPNFCEDFDLRAVMTLTGSIAMLKQIPAGQSVSYGSRWTAPAATRIALVPLGYADGIPRSAVGAHVLIQGRKQQVVGRVAMDQFVVAIDDDLMVREGDDVIVFGEGATGAPTAEEWGVASGSIGYEVVTRIGSRVTRDHQSEREPQ